MVAHARIGLARYTDTVSSVIHALSSPHNFAINNSRSHANVYKRPGQPTSVAAHT